MSGFPSARQRAHSSPSCCPKEANPNCLWQDFSSFMFMMFSHVIILYHKLPTSLYSREEPLLQCFFSSFLAFSSFAFFFLKEKKNRAMYVYAYTMPRRHLPVNNLCIPEVRYCFCFPCTVLLQHGADPNIRNTDGKSALDLADPSAKAVLTGKETELPSYPIYELLDLSACLYKTFML